MIALANATAASFSGSRLPTGREGSFDLKHYSEAAARNPDPSSLARRSRFAPGPPQSAPRAEPTNLPIVGCRPGEKSRVYSKMPA
jgi:hypothetical protein